MPFGRSSRSVLRPEERAPLVTIPPMATEELEDFKTTELAKVKADFQAKAWKKQQLAPSAWVPVPSVQIDEITRQRDMLQKEVEATVGTKRCCSCVLGRPQTAGRCFR